MESTVPTATVMFDQGGFCDMAKEDMTRDEIFAAAKQPLGGAEPPPVDKPEAVEEPLEAEETAAEEPVAEPADDAPAEKPTGAAAMLAAARGGEATDEPADDAPAKKPSGAAAMLAAARDGEAADEPAGDAPAEKTEPTAEPVTAAVERPEGDRPSVHQMLEAVRAGGSPADADEATETAGTTPKLVIPTRPKPPAATPTPAPAADQLASSRRSFVAASLVAAITLPLQLVATPFALAWTTFTAACGLFTLAMARMMMPNTLVEAPMKFKIGLPGDFPPEQVSPKFKAEKGIWVVRTAQYNGEDQLCALISVCTHLGCTPNWLEGEQKFKCPCHGSGFYISGVNFEGPAPRPLERAGLRIAEDGMLEVDKSRKFQQEMGQWEDPSSFVQV